MSAVGYGAVVATTCRSYGISATDGCIAAW
jgi:hypothetical protein